MRRITQVLIFVLCTIASVVRSDVSEKDLPGLYTLSSGTMSFCTNTLQIRAMSSVIPGSGLIFDGRSDVCDAPGMAFFQVHSSLPAFSVQNVQKIGYVMLSVSKITCGRTVVEGAALLRVNETTNIGGNAMQPNLRYLTFSGKSGEQACLYIAPAYLASPTPSSSPKKTPTVSPRVRSVTYSASPSASSSPSNSSTAAPSNTKLISIPDMKGSYEKVDDISTELAFCKNSLKITTSLLTVNYSQWVFDGESTLCTAGTTEFYLHPYLESLNKADREKLGSMLKSTDEMTCNGVMFNTTYVWTPLKDVSVTMVNGTQAISGSERYIYITSSTRQCLYKKKNGISMWVWLGPVIGVSVLALIILIVSLVCCCGSSEE